MLDTLPMATAPAELSVLDIARHAAALYKEAGSERFLHPAPDAHSDCQREYDELLDRSEAFENLGFLSPVITLADSAGLLALASREMGRIAGWDLPPDLRTLREGRVALALVRALRVVASAAGIALGAIYYDTEAPEIDLPGCEPPAPRDLGPWCRRDKLRNQSQPA